MNASAPAAPPPATTGRNRDATTRTSAVAIGRIEPKFEPPRLVLNAVEGWGKTTFGAYAPKPVILMAGGERGGGETGYQTLLSKGLVPQIDGAVVNNWSETLGAIEQLGRGEHDCKTLILDAIGGFERFCHEHVCNTHFGGDWGERGFLSYHKGYDQAIGEWLQLLARLDQLRNTGRMMVVMLSHTKVKTMPNPLGPDVQKYVPDVHDKTWGVTARWADAVMFGAFRTIMDDDREAAKTGKGKGIGGMDRVVYTSNRDALVAKNRYAMPDEIDIPNDPACVFSTVWNHIKPENK